MTFLFLPAHAREVFQLLSDEHLDKLVEIATILSDNPDETRRVFFDERLPLFMTTFLRFLIATLDNSGFRKLCKEKKMLEWTPCATAVAFREFYDRKYSPVFAKFMEEHPEPSDEAEDKFKKAYAEGKFGNKMYLAYQAKLCPLLKWLIALAQ